MPTPQIPETKKARGAGPARLAILDFETVAARHRAVNWNDA